MCLDTSTDVTCVANRLQYNKHKFHTRSINRLTLFSTQVVVIDLYIARYLKRRAQAVLTRAHMMQNAPPPKYLKLHEMISRDRQVATAHDLVSSEVFN